MSAINKFCEFCGNQITATMGQSVVGDQLRWHCSYQCSHCGSNIELDDIGYPPEEIRNELLAAGGKWNLLVDEPPQHRIQIMKILRQTCNLTLAEAKAASQHIPGKVASGTQPEMEWLRDIFSSVGFKARVEKN